MNEAVVVVLDVRGFVWRADAGHCRHRVALVGAGDRRGAAERVPDEQPDLATRAVHELDGPNGVGDLVGEGPVAPVALGITKSEIVEAQHPDALAGELL